MKTLKHIMAVGLCIGFYHVGFAQSSETLVKTKKSKEKVMVQPRPFVKQDAPQLGKITITHESKPKSANIRHTGAASMPVRKESDMKAKVVLQD
jgi:hypothetical protein